MTLNNVHLFENPHNLSLPTYPMMLPPTYLNCRPPGYSYAQLAAHSPSQPANDCHIASNGATHCSSSAHLVQNRSLAQNHDAGITQTPPSSHQEGQFENPSTWYDTSIPSAAASDSPNNPTTLSPALRTDTASEPSCPHSSINSIYNLPDTFQKQVYLDPMLPIFDNDDPELLEESIVFDDQTVTLDYRATPNTLLEPFTPNLDQQSPLIILNSHGNKFDGATSYQDVFTQLQHNQLDLEASAIEADLMLTSRIDSDLPLTGYPPLPELSTSFDDQLQGLDHPHLHFGDLYFPAGPYHGGEMSAVFEELDPEQNLHRGYTANSSPSRRKNASRAASRQLESRSGQRDTSKDDFLVRCKGLGWSYKQIKEVGGFEEAESTLRGRYRALTKPREARLRKPEWARKDVSELWLVAVFVANGGCRQIELLCEGVDKCSKSNPTSSGSSTAFDAISIGQYVNKVPWKQVAEYMESKGAYRYGNATVKKKYLEILKARGMPV